MVIIVMTNYPKSAKGEISQWLIEPSVGVFVGNVSARVREELWKKIQVKMVDKSRAILIYNDNNEQGFSIKTCGYSRKKPIDCEGVNLIQTIKKLS